MGQIHRSDRIGLQGRDPRDTTRTVLGPTWNLGYNSVLHTTPSRGCHAVCYVDDNYPRWGNERVDVLSRGEVVAAATIRSIRKVGLKIVAKKTEALFMYNRTEVGMPPPDQYFFVNEIRI